MLALLLQQVSLLTKKGTPLVFVKGSETLQLSYQFIEVPVVTMVLQLQHFGSRLRSTPALPASGVGQRDQELFTAATGCTSVRLRSHAGICRGFARAVLEVYQPWISVLFIWSFCTELLPLDFYGFEADCK